MMSQAEAAAGIEHFVGSSAKRNGHAHFAAEIERQEHVLLLKIDVAVSGVRKVPLEDKGGAIAEDRRGHDAFEKSVDGDFARNAAFFGEGDPFTKTHDFDDQGHVQSDFELHREALLSDVSDFGADGEKHGLNAVEGGFVARDHERSFALADG